MHFLKVRTTNNRDIHVRIAPEKMYTESECASKETENPFLRDELDCQAQDEELNRQLERLWKTDFENHEVETKVCASLGDKRALVIMERSYNKQESSFRAKMDAVDETTSER